MAILFITHKFPPSIGGMQKQSYELINGIRKHTKTYTIIQSPTESKVVFFLKLKYRIKKMLDLHSDIEAIHCNDGLIACACIWIKKEYDIPLTATFHGLDIVFPNRLFQKYLVPKLRGLDLVFAVSQATKIECLKRGFNNRQVIEICNGVDHQIESNNRQSNSLNPIHEKYDIDLTDKKIILSIGRSVKRKGFSWFAQKVMPELPSNVYYLIVGPRSNTKSFFHRVLYLLPSDLRSQVELFLGYPSDDDELDEILNIPSSRSFHLGTLSDEELQNVMELADIFVMPNINVEGDMEGFGLVGLEANLSGKYVVASEIEGITSAIINGSNGMMIPSHCSKSWSTALIKLLGNKRKLSQYGDSAKKYVLQNFGWDKMAFEYFVEFQRLTGKRPQSTVNTYKEVA